MTKLFFSYIFGELKQFIIIPVSPQIPKAKPTLVEAYRIMGLFPCVVPSPEISCTSHVVSLKI